MSRISASGAKPPYMVAAEALRRNKGQWEAYESTGNCVILAGPGSGKTKTLTIKMARTMAEEITPPRGIACITYNNQCARELKRRLSNLGVEESKRTSICTLHSFCLQHIVLPFGNMGGFAIPIPLKVAMTTERQKLWHQAVEKIKGPDEPPQDWIFRCEYYRRTHLDRDSTGWYGDNKDAAQIIEAYEKKLSTSGLVDFEVMVYLGLQLVERYEWVRRALRAKFPVLFVDEYQDLGLSLHRIVSCLCLKAGMRLIAVGDPDQSIYGFTGAEPALLHELAKFEQVKRVELKLNYRCGPTIIRASEIALGEAREFESGIEQQGMVDIHHRPAGLDDQADFICDSIIPDALGRREGRQRGDIAVLYRTQYEGDIIAKAIERRDWEFIRIDQGNPYPRSPMVYWLEDCAAWCAGGWKSGIIRLSGLVFTWLRFNESMSSDAERRQLLINLVKFLHSSRQPAQPLSNWLSRFHSQCLKSTLEREVRLRDDYAALKKLTEVCASDSRLAGFTVSAFGGQGGERTHLHLMTLHSAKGLEFDVVIIIGLEDGKLPDYRANTDNKLKEERRLFYVGLTRARHEVHLVYSGWYATPPGRTISKGASRFISEVRDSLET